MNYVGPGNVKNGLGKFLILTLQTYTYPTISEHFERYLTYVVVIHLLLYDIDYSCRKMN